MIRKRKIWVNVYPPDMRVSGPYGETRAEADKFALVERIACVSVEVSPNLTERDIKGQVARDRKRRAKEARKVA